MKQSGDFIDAAQFSVGDLREALFGRNPEVSPLLAVNLLARKSYPEKLSDLARLLEDSTQPSQVRHNAALELSKMPGEEPQAVLRAHAETGDPFVRRGVSAALARYGKPGLAELLGAGGFVLPEKSYLAYPDPARAEKIEIGAPPAISMTSIARQISALLPAVEFKPVLAQRLQCRQRETVFALNAAASAETVRSSASSLIGLVLERFHVEVDRWEARYFVGARRTKSVDELDVFVATPAGQVIAAGTARLTGDDADFEIATLDIPGIVPFSITGRYRGGRLTIDEATSDTRSGPRIEAAARPPHGTKPAR